METALKILLALFRRRLSYVVIYDDDLTEEEYYYGYFSTRAEALMMYDQLKGGNPALYHNAKLCVILEAIGPGEL